MLGLKRTLRIPSSAPPCPSTLLHAPPQPAHTPPQPSTALHSPAAPRHKARFPPSSCSSSQFPGSSLLTLFTPGSHARTYTPSLPPAGAKKKKKEAEATPFET
ncbi:hypothetical protein E2C01_060485 [Portunus trituberculatus]|uniref:Uncharacterized protein n=1 Tax=Portunus trituberculatus TaxID=210409 RepID=A0A5B7HAM2_PORTR|nr:hypothetical protein [Portunus trituberculatus]